MDTEELARRLDSVTVREAGVKLSVPRSARSRSDLTAPVKRGHRYGIDRFLMPWVVLDLGGRDVRVNPRVEDKRIRRKVLQEVGGGTNLNALRPAGARKAMERLLDRMRSAERKAWRTADRPGLERRASDILKNRERTDRTDEQLRAVDRVKKELLGPLRNVSEQELVDLYRECQVRTVMEG
jgi:hypothetical protein